MKRYIIAAAIAIASISASAQKVTMLVYGKDTVEIKPGMDITKTIMSINEARFKKELVKQQRIQDSIDEAIENAPSLYYKNQFFDEKGRLRSSNEIERNPSKEFLAAKAPLYDSIISYSDINYQVFDSINRLRIHDSLKEAEMIFDPDAEFDFVDEAIFELSKEKKIPLLVKDMYKTCDCRCYEYIAENILSVKKIKKALLDSKTESFNISILQEKKGIYVYVTCIKRLRFFRIENTYPVFIED
jgi:hypothetical protein